MPIEVSRLEQGILPQRITGSFNATSMREAHDTGFEIMHAAGDTKIVLITEGIHAALPDVDVSIAAFRQLTKENTGFVLRSIVVVVSPALRIGLSGRGRITGVPFLLVPDLNTALTHARRILASAASPASDGDQ